MMVNGNQEKMKTKLKGTKKSDIDSLLEKVDVALQTNRERKPLFDNWVNAATFHIGSISYLGYDSAKGIAEAYTRLIFAVADRLSGGSQEIRAHVATQMGQTIKSTTYYRYVSELAELMSKQSLSGKSESSKDFWLAAERHLYSMVDGIIREQTSASGALRALADALDTFSSDKHLAKIRQRAFEIWKSSSKEHEPIYYWRLAEIEILEELKIYKKNDDNAD